MVDRIEALERLQRLRESGALSEAEFEAEKARLDAPAAPIETATDPEAYAEERAKPWWLWILGALVALLLAVLAWMVFGIGREQSVPQPQVDTNQATVELPNVQAAAPGMTELSPQEQLRLAAFAALGPEGRRTVTDDDGEKEIKPLRLLRLPSGSVLISTTEIEDACHACVGSLNIHYLKEDGQRFEVVKSWDGFVSGNGFGGAPSEVEVSDKYAANPMLVSEAGYTGQGYTCSARTLVELRPGGPVLAGTIPVYFSNEGAVVEETGKTMGGQSKQTLEGEIVNIVQGKTFEVRAKDGDETIIEKYVRKGDTFVPVAKDTRFSC